jgi:hypothetical protein
MDTVLELLRVFEFRAAKVVIGAPLGPINVAAELAWKDFVRAAQALPGLSQAYGEKLIAGVRALAALEGKR